MILIQVYFLGFLQRSIFNLNRVQFPAACGETNYSVRRELLSVAEPRSVRGVAK